MAARGAVARVERGERGWNETKGLFEGTFKRVAIFSNRRELVCPVAAGVAGGVLDAVELEDESSEDDVVGVATALPGRRPSALSASIWQLAAAEGAAAAAGTPPVR